MSAVAVADPIPPLHLSNGDGEKAKLAYAPTHPGLFQVEFQPGAYNSSLVAQRDFAKGETLACFSHAKPTDTIRYSSVQVSEDKHIELHSDLLYCNHSCAPNVHFDVSTATQDGWAAKAYQNIRKGDALTFFYPSTEWDMNQPFGCHCGEKQCMGQIRGAKYIPVDQLYNGPFPVNNHIRRLKTQQVGEEQQQATN